MMICWIARIVCRWGGIYIRGDVAGHDAGRGEGFAGVGQQAFVVLIGGDLEHGAGFVEAQGECVGFEVVVEGAFGGFVESF